MAGTGPALIAAAAGVGFGHAVLPDHWMPLAVIGRTRRYPVRRVARLSGLAGIAHVIVSVVLGGVIIAIGLQFRSAIADAQDAIVGGLLIATGAVFLLLEVSGRGHRHDHDHDHSHPHAHAHEDPGGIAAVMVPFGAAASPDLTILPVFLAAAGSGAGVAVGSLIAFAAVTILTIVSLTLAATFGGYQIQGRWLERWGDVITAVVLVAIGALIAARVL